MPKCCEISVKYEKAVGRGAGGSEDLSSIDPTPSDQTITCDDAAYLAKNESSKHLKLLEYSSQKKDLRYQMGNWFRFNYPQQFNISSNIYEGAVKIMGDDYKEDKETAQKLDKFFKEYAGKIQDLYFKEKKEAKQAGMCATACINFSVIAGIVLKDYCGVSAKIVSSKNVFHRWVEFTINGKEYILDFTADQFDVSAEDDSKKTISPILIPKDKINENPYLKLLYGNVAAKFSVNNQQREYLQSEVKAVVKPNIKK